MDYEMEELVPIVGKLAEKYTSHESTSITYRKSRTAYGGCLILYSRIMGKQWKCAVIK